MSFEAFTDGDFEIFGLPDFDTRMPALKARLTPKLKQLGETLLPQITRSTGQELFVHTALHLRRSVNPADETWTCFSRNNRAYKPFVHLRVAINGSGVKAACFMEEYAGDKPVLADGLKRNAKAVAAYMATHPQIRSHDAEANYGKLLSGRSLKTRDVLELADRLVNVKSQHANFSMRFPREIGVPTSPHCVNEILRALEMLIPLYRLGAEPGYRMEPQVKAKSPAHAVE